ncbi:MAG: type II toxin-antitoxin system RelE family toxin [Planctomycetaceae bacterium]
MKTKVEISDQVLNFVRSLAPEPRRLLRQGLRDLQDELGDIKQLEGDLAGWCRLRIKSYRIIFRYEVEKSHRTARCVFAERRALVYELFTEVVRLLTDS